MKAKPTTKEQLIYFLYNHISLGTYDRRFIENLVTSYISTLQPVTTNQNALLEKITLRYERQLRKEEIDANDMVTLPWNTKPVESLPKYTEAYVEISEDVVKVRCPFKTEFIKSFKELPNVKWEAETKTWFAPASEEILKKIIEIINLNYPKVNFCNEITDILNTVEAYKDIKYWNPTLVKINGLYYVVATNRWLEEAISDIPLNSSLSSIARLAYHGVSISRTVLADVPTNMTDDDISFALDKDVAIECDINTIVRKLSLIKADYVLMREWNALNKNTASQLQTALEAEHIRVEIIDRKNKPSLTSLKQASLPVLLGSYSFSTPISVMFAKVVSLTNSNPIEIK